VALQYQRAPVYDFPILDVSRERFAQHMGIPWKWETQIDKILKRTDKHKPKHHPKGGPGHVLSTEGCFD